MARTASASAAVSSSSRPPANIELKIAILRSRRMQREIARDAGLFESRLSDIVTGRRAPATPDEQKSIARVLRCSIRSLFPNTDNN